MLANPDIQPTASINCWIVSILTFHFTLVHVKGTHHGPDGLSRRPPQPDDVPDNSDNEFEDWIDRLHGFIHQINAPYKSISPYPQVSTLAATTDISKEDIRTPLTYDMVP